MAKHALEAICIWDNSPLPLEWVSMIRASVVNTMSLFPSWGERLRRAENDPHFGLLNNIQVLTGDSDNPPSTVEEPIKIIVHNNITKRNIKTSSDFFLQQFISMCICIY